MPLKQRKCDQYNDFGYQVTKRDHAPFYEVKDQKKAEFERVFDSLFCIDEPVSLYGNWNSQEASVLLVAFEKCDPTLRSTCKSE